MSDALTQALSEALRTYAPARLNWTGPDGSTQTLAGEGGGLVSAVE